MPKMWRAGLARTILAFAVVHLAYLFGFALWSGRYSLLNLFVILDLHEAYPPFSGSVYALLSPVIFLAVYLASLVSLRKKEDRFY